ncbi:hypothetical protein ACHHYP_12725 [Achlya hypogyna]|uniref:EF-hand domain-containing protein n=1 Tax=Achlya hypogyna TaxID=1202772 RepID=A0A1V9ZGH0_ACHHY|nr:hypothetical protein ACHHYP_12725 [Achlya hypogyna]
MPVPDLRRTHAPAHVSVPAAVALAFHKQQAETMFTNQAKSAEASSSSVPSRPSYVPKLLEPPQIRELRDKNRRPTALLPRETLVERPPVGLPAHASRESIATSDDVTALLMALDLTHVEYAPRERLDRRRSSEVPMDLPAYLTLILGNMERAGAGKVDKVDMTVKLTRVFHQIDNDEDGFVTMSEFTSYILDAAAGLSDIGPSSGLHKYNKVPTMANVVLSKPIEKLVYLHGADQYLAIESQSRVFQVYDAHDGAPVATSAAYSGGVFVDAMHEPTVDYVVTSTTDATINFWDTTEFKLRQQLPTTDVQTVLRWHASSKRLFAASVTGEISAWSVDSLRRTGSFATHLADVTDVVFAQPSTLVVASLGAGLRIYDVATTKLLKTLDGHRHGVAFLRYVTNHEYVLSGGIDHDLRLWNPYVATSIARLRGHDHQLVGVEWVDGSHEIVSADCAGFVRVWDVRKYRCVQTLSAFPAKPVVKPKPVTAMMYVPTKKRVVLASSVIQFHDAFEWNASKSTDDALSGASQVVYLPACMSLVSVTGRHLRVWNAHTGTLLHNLRHVTRAPISTACHGAGSTCYVGMLTGHVAHVNVTNAAILKDAALHRQEVTGLELLQARGSPRLVSISLDGTCVVADIVSLEALATLNHWHGVNCFPASRHDAPPDTGHSYHVPPRLRAQYSDLAVDALKRIFTAYDPEDAGVAPLSAGRDLFVAVTRVMHRTVYQLNESYVAAALAAFEPRRSGFISFAEFLHLVLDTWHGRGAVVSPVTAVAVSARYNVVVTASVDGTFCVWNASTGIPIMTSPVAHDHGVTAVAFLEPHPIFLVADDRNGISVYCIPPHPSRFHCLHECHAHSAVIRRLLWCPPATFLAGDDLGHVTAYELKGFFEDHAADRRPNLRRLGTQQLSVRNVAKGGSRISKRRFSIHEFQYTRLGRIDARQSWAAHKDAVCSMQACGAEGQTTHAFVSCGLDGAIYAWACDGVQLGALDPSLPGASNQGEWRLFVNPAVFHVRGHIDSE